MKITRIGVDSGKLAFLMFVEERFGAPRNA